MRELMSTLAGRPGSALAGYHAGRPVALASLRTRAVAWGQRLGRVPGQAVALYADDSLEFAAALLGSWQARKTVWLAADTLAASCALLGRHVDAFAGDFPAEWAPVRVAPEAWPHPQDAVEQGALPSLHDLDPEFPALVVFTSGSSGEPTAVPKLWRQLADEVTHLESVFGPAAGGAAVVATVSHQHIYGLLFKVLWPLASGRPLHAERIDYPEQLAALLAAAPSVLVASPAHLKRLPVHLDWSMAAHQLRAVFSSGGSLPLEASHLAAGLLGQVPVEIYGSSETGGIAWRRQIAAVDGGDQPAAAWTPLPGVAWRIGQERLLSVQSAHLPDDSWFELADCAEPAAAGFLLLGRSDRIVKIEEKRVSLEAIEGGLRATGLVSEVRVVVDQSAGATRPLVAAFAVLAEPGRLQLQVEGKAAFDRRLRNALAGQVERVALPRRWRYLDSLPVNAQGKTTQAMLLALLAAPRPVLPDVRWIERDAQSAQLELTVPADLLYLDGHFPGAPILPGVVQIDWAQHFARQQFALDGDFRAMQALKFQQVIVPGHPVRLHLQYDAGKGSLSFSYRSAAGQHASGRLVFAVPEAQAVPHRATLESCPEPS